MKLHLIVADEFRHFASKPGVMPYSVLLENLRHGRLDTLRGATLVAGQGLGEMEIDHAYCLGMSLGLLPEFECWRTWHNQGRADYALSHKHRTENVLISRPRRLADDRFEADLLINARNELMLDHLTGMHVQGMVLTEACRQMFIATTEAHCLSADAPPKRYFVINEMNMRFLEFAFPLPATIRYQLLERRQPRANRVQITADMAVWQNGREVAGMAVKFGVFDGAQLAPRETQLADAALAQCLDDTVAHFASMGRVVELPVPQPASQPVAAMA
ncbi:AfsA-related hotdog domain-containing protein [Burkholderia sp. D-99]|uniref:AfsA-related hotdog domain-containing protein n=1 Tax=unclassified Burkholderia TaxID=2613784 RepID=UPI00141E87BE|nr:AfsA-related hotdog domain-containing protein [Burkholderia sp. D-99]NHV26851.1 hypothetical protein [Burkholderia sp. D-99]